MGASATHHDSFGHVNTELYLSKFNLWASSSQLVNHVSLENSLCSARLSLPSSWACTTSAHSFRPLPHSIPLRSCILREAACEAVRLERRNGASAIEPHSWNTSTKKKMILTLFLGLEECCCGELERLKRCWCVEVVGDGCHVSEQVGHHRVTRTLPHGAHKDVVRHSGGSDCQAHVVGFEGQ